MNILEKIKSLDEQIKTYSKIILRNAVNSGYLDTYKTAEKILNLVTYVNNLKQYKHCLICKLYNYQGIEGYILQLKYEKPNLSNFQIADIVGISIRTYYRIFERLRKDY